MKSWRVSAVISYQLSLHIFLRKRWLSCVDQHLGSHNFQSRFLVWERDRRPSGFTLYEYLRPRTNECGISTEQRSTSLNSTCYSNQMPFNAIQPDSKSSSNIQHGGNDVERCWMKKLYPRVRGFLEILNVKGYYSPVPPAGPVEALSILH